MNWLKRHKLNPSNELEVKSNSQTNLFDLNPVMNWLKRQNQPLNPIHKPKTLILALNHSKRQVKTLEWFAEWLFDQIIELIKEMNDSCDLILEMNYQQNESWISHWIQSTSKRILWRDSWNESVKMTHKLQLNESESHLDDYTVC